MKTLNQTLKRRDRGTKVFSAIAAITASVTWARTSFALPLLAESASQRSGAALTLYPDHLDPNKFYFMPNSSMIGRDNRGVPTFSFTYYGLNDPNAADAGALMVYVGRLTSDSKQEQAMKDFLVSHPRAGIAVLPVKESTISLSSTTGTPVLQKFFDEFDFSKKGGRAEDEIGVNAVLTKIGAKVFKASLLSEAGAALKYDMCYKVDGLGPSMDGEIWIEMNRVYDHFKASASAGTLWWRVSINTEVEKLAKEKIVRWKITGGDAKDEDYIRDATITIIERMFKPELAMSSAGTTTVWEQATPFSFGASYTHKEEHDLEHWIIKRQPAETLEFCVPLVLKDIQAYKNQCVVNADDQKLGVSQ